MMTPLSSSRWLALLLPLLPLCAAGGDVMVVTATDEPEEPRVLEIFDFQTKEWRAVEKSQIPMLPGPKYRAESLRPGNLFFFLQFGSPLYLTKT